jgi:hypothetical protein
MLLKLLEGTAPIDPMQPIAKRKETFRQVRRRHLDPDSLQFRLTLEISLPFY